MATGFIYVVNSVTKDYEQQAFCNVPTEWGDRLYFGPCKRPMRPRMKENDYIFGISPSATPTRRILFAGQIEERITFAEAYNRFPDLRGPEGPIHVRPITGKGRFPQSSYQHIPDAMHADDWEKDLASTRLDRFFVCRQRNVWLGSWLGSRGPKIDDEILAFLKTCSVYGPDGYRGENSDATFETPICIGSLFRGLHLETDKPENLLALCKTRLTSEDLTAIRHSIPASPRRPRASGICGVNNPPIC
jgi:hypothetical protein